MMGRTIEIQRASKHVACFTFDELCDRPLGSADYIAIADKYSNIILTNVPILYFDQREKIRRFITLLDVLYEHHTRLIISADTDIATLFRPARSALEVNSNSSSNANVNSAATNPGNVVAASTSTASTDTKASSEQANSSTKGASASNKNTVTASVSNQKEDEKFASSRALSRLIEMNSVEYLQKSAAIHAQIERSRNPK
jgi:predicted ATPase